MAIRDDREYRNLGTFEIRSEEADDQPEDLHARGYASTFEEYKLMTIDGEDFFERIDPHAFDEADLSDVIFLRDHTGPVLARTKNGAINLSIDEHGLHSDVDLSLTEASRAMLEDIRVGNYTQMSFSFVVPDGGDHMEGNTRVIDRFSKIYDISAVAFPANPYTEIGLSARSLFDGVIEQRQAERLAAEQRERDRARLALRLKLLKGGH